MMKIFFILTGLLVAMTALAQQPVAYQKQVVLGMGGGYILPLNKFKTANAMDDLVGYRDRFWGLNPSIHVFPARRWGVMIDFEVDVAAVNRAQKGRLNSTLEAIYADNYELVKPQYFYGYGWETYDYPAGFRLASGPAYRYESGRFMLYSSIGAGITSFRVTGMSAFLLKKNTNEYHSVYMDSWKGVNPFTMVAGVLVGYKISRNMALAFNSRASYFGTNFSQTLSRKDLYTGKSENDAIFQFKRNSLSLSANLNLLIFANFSRRR